MHLIAATKPLASAIARLDRLVAGRAAPVVLTTAADTVTFAAEWVSSGCAATVHEDGQAAVGLRALATVLGGLAEPAAELRVEGTRLAVRTPSARFALPLLAVAQPERPEGAVLGLATGLREAAQIVAEATARDGLPLFSAVRVRSAGERLTLLATDRFRAAVASVAWQPRSSEPVDALVEASALAAAVRFADADVPVRAGDGWFGVDWPGGGVAVAQMALPFPDAQIESLLRVDPVAVVEIDAGALRGAVDRVAPFASDGIMLEIADGMVSLRGSGEMGDAREEVKASTSGDHTSTRYQVRYLAEAVRACAGYPGGTFTIQVQQGIRPTLFHAGDLRYLVVPLR